MGWLYRVVRNIVEKFRMNGDSHVVLYIKRAYSGYFALIPDNLDIDNHLRNYPLVDYSAFELNGDKILSSKGLKFDKDKLMYLIGLISAIPAKNKDSITKDGFIPLNSTYLQKFFKDYKDYLDYLIDTGIIISDGYYIPEEKSIGYKFSEIYENTDLVRYSYRRFENSIEPIEESVYNEDTGDFERNQLLDCSYLSHWYNERKLRIDYQKAKEYGRILKNKKLQEGQEAWDINRDSGEKKNPISQYNALIYNVEAVQTHDYKAKIDSNIHRLHSVLTNIQKDYRNFITYDGQPLVSIDIKNSQPYLVSALTNPNFWSNTNPNLKFSQMPNNIQGLFNTPTTFNITPISIMLGNFFDNLSPSDFDEYKRIVSSGEMYETVQRWILEEKEIDISREDAKTTMFTLIFSSNRDNPNDENHWLKVYYREKFPSIAELFKIIKRQYKGVDRKKQHARLACLLQSIESEIVLHRCCKRIWEEGEQQVPIFTIHDSIVTTKGNEDFVKRIMEEELTRAIGVPPTLQVEEWRENKLKHQDILIQINS
ncbi:hypothetical protein [uncultured Dysgonomonas sp.]|uniref:Uncharacterized protein n=1 Tax=uncultured Dysgonomonas sp. TaxID=206096 RepID=A0A212J474_9BACT|nr:hypothetical protein [uncultured Dysgonomonas sp.]SBV94207.1 conserved hypothetical protein [uncultured Dysgonomonas sp.]